MDTIRAALGEATISYFGFSYGSELGATWATLFPSTVRAAVLDGAVDPTAGDEQRDLQQIKGFEDSADDVPGPVQRRQQLRVPQRRRRRKAPTTG